MFRCAITGKNSKLGEKMNHLVVKTRAKIYSQRVWEDGELMDIEIGTGYETVKEIAVTLEGLKLYEQMVANGTAESFLSKL